MREVTLSRGKVALVDDEDYGFLMHWKWHAAKNSQSEDFYARRGVRVGGKLKMISMARVVADAQDGEEVDHINHDTLDNRRANLRVCSHTENCLNRRKPKRRRGCSSRYRGVSFYMPAGMWVAHFRREHIGYFVCERDAAQAYNARVKERGFEEVSPLNDIEGRGVLTHYPDSYHPKKKASKFRGVTRRSDGRWKANIAVNKNRIYLGVFDSEIEAAKAFDLACDDSGLSGRKNFPD